MTGRFELLRSKTWFNVAFSRVPVLSRAIPFFLIGRLETIVSSVLVFGVHLRRELDRYVIFSLGYDGMGA